jgi:hypothetical protein
VRELIAVLKELKSDTAKKAFLALQLKIWYRGLRLVEPKPFSNGKDKTIGGVAELTTRLEDILSKRHRIPASPPLEKEPEALQSLGLPVNRRQELMEEYKQQAAALQVKQEDLLKLYTPKASLVPWAAVGPVQFPEPLTELQKKFEKGTRFKEDGEEFVALGLEWDVAQNDYTLFYCEKADSRSVKQLDEDAVLPSYFKTVRKVVNGAEIVQLALS